MRRCGIVVGGLGVWCLAVSVAPLSAGQRVYNVNGSWLTGNSDTMFDGAMKASGAPSHAVYYENNAARGFRCPHKKYAGESGYTYEAGKHAGPQGGYLIILGGSTHLKVPSNWDGTYSTNMDMWTCRYCNRGDAILGWEKIPILWYEIPTNNVVPPWMFNSPYVENLQVTTDNNGASGSTITGGSFDVVPPAGATLDDGEFNEYDFNTAPVWTYYPGHEPEGTVPPVYEGDAWTAANVGMQLQHSANSRNSLANIDVGISGLLSEQSAGWDWLRNQTFNPTVNVENVEPEIIVNPTVTVTPDVSVTVEGGSSVDVSGVISAVDDLQAEVVERLEANLTDSDFPDLPEDDQASHDAAHDADLSEKLTAIETEVQKIDVILRGVVSSFGGLMGSLVGSWEGLGRAKPNISVSMSIPLMEGWQWVIDLTPYENLIAFFRAFSSVLMFLGFLFSVYKLLLGLGA